MRLWLKFVLVLSMLAYSTVFARADEVTDQIKEGLQFYDRGSYSEAVSALNFAVGQIQQQQAASLQKVFPPPLQGWQAEESKGEFAGAAFMGGGVSASRHYYVEGSEKSIDIEIVTDSPLLQSMMMFISNPAFAASQPGTKLTKIEGHKAIQKFLPEDREGDINIVIGSRMLVSIKGQGVESLDDLLAYASEIDYSSLQKLLEK